MIRVTANAFPEVSVHHRLIGLALTSAIAANGAAAQVARPATATPLTRASFIATMDGEFRKLDTNGDQIVTKGEVEANQRARRAADAARSARAAFAKIDADRNGQLTVDEYIRATAQQQGSADGSAIMGRLDANRDQKVTVVEYRILTLTNFDRIDSDRDGILTLAEQRASTVGR